MTSRSGDPAAIAEARAHLREAERSKTAALLGGAASTTPSTATAIGPNTAAAGATPGGVESPSATRTPVGLATVRPGTTVWEISMRTGVPVERILEFNAQGGNPLDPNRLQVGQQIYVPLGEGDIQDRPRTAAEVQMMKDEANGVSYFENLRFRTPGEVEADWARAASLDAPASPVGPPPPVEEQSLLDFVWRDFDWRSVGQTAFHAAADIGDSVGAFAQGFGSGLADMATGAVLGAAELAALNAKLTYGTPRERLEALQALWGMGSAVVDHTLESGRYLVHGVTNPGDVLDAMAQLGIQGSAEQVGRATASAEGTVTALYSMAGPIRSLGRRIVSEADEAAEAAGRTSAAAAGETIGGKTPTAAREIRLGDGDVVYKVDEFGRTIEVDARISGPHRGRPKGRRPDPPGGLTPGEHRGHLAPEGGAPDPRLVNVPENIISEAPKSNLGPKKAFDNLLSRVAAQNPNAVVRGRHRPVFRPGETRPYAVEHRIVVDGKEVFKILITNE